MKCPLLFMLSAMPFMAQGQTTASDAVDKVFEYAVTSQYDAPAIITPLKDIGKITIEEGKLVFHDHAGRVLNRAPLNQLERLSFSATATDIASPTAEPLLPELTAEDLAGAEVFTPAGIKVASSYKQLPRGIYIVRHAGVVRKLMKR